VEIFEEHAVKIVSPYKYVPPEQRVPDHSEAAIGNFDWVDALRMLSHSASLFGYPVHAITDAPLPVPHYQFNTQHQDLMVWILEVSLAYLRSEHFDQDTAFVCPDSLMNNHLPQFGGFDLAVCIRFNEKYDERPILNSVQLWAVAGKDRLIQFYERCLEIALTLPAEQRRWGGDTIPLEQLLSPHSPGFHHRAGINVLMYPFTQIMRTVHKKDIEAIRNGGRPYETHAPVIDFKSTRKAHMRAYYEAMYENR
jgi:hypothetical protein